jgi:hypothetical protein
MIRAAAIFLCLSLFSSLQALAEPEKNGSCRKPIRLDTSASALKQAFNESPSSVRLLFVVDPICPTCLRGADDLNRAVLAPNKQDKRLVTFVVHLPVIGGKEIDTQRTCKLLTDGNITHFWDATGEFGRALASALELKTKAGKDVYAWDVWLMYGPDAQWSGTLPPRPRKMMHQLMALSGDASHDFFDANEFALQVEKALGSSPR